MNENVKILFSLIAAAIIAGLVGIIFFGLGPTEHPVDAFPATVIAIIFVVTHIVILKKMGYQFNH